jgi:hypothetical protein
MKGVLIYFRRNKELFGKVHTRTASDTLADGCSVKKTVGSTEKLASLHVNQGDEIFPVMGINAA